MKHLEWIHWLPNGHARELVELHKLIVDDIVCDIRAMPSGGRSFPFNDLAVTVFPVEASLAAAIRQSWVEHHQLEADLRREFSNLDVPVPAGFRVMVEISDGEGDKPFRIEKVHRTSPTVFPSAPEVDAPSERCPATIRLRVEEGATETGVTDFSFSSPVVMIGRRKDVIGRDGRLQRSNHVGLREPSVSRAHCELRWHSLHAGYRLVDLKSLTGTQLVRSGLPYDVPRIGEGLAVLAGDHIRLGKVLIRVEQILDDGRGANVAPKSTVLTGSGSFSPKSS